MPTAPIGSQERIHMQSPTGNRPTGYLLRHTYPERKLITVCPVADPHQCLLAPNSTSICMPLETTQLAASRHAYEGEHIYMKEKKNMNHGCYKPREGTLIRSSEGPPGVGFKVKWLAGSTWCDDEMYLGWVVGER